MKRIEAGWEIYRRNVLPPRASEVQITETRNGFYAGAWHLFSTIMGAMGPDNAEPTATELAVLDDIDRELKAFAQSKRG